MNYEEKYKLLVSFCKGVENGVKDVDITMLESREAYQRGAIDVIDLIMEQIESLNEE